MYCTVLYWTLLWLTLTLLWLYCDFTVMYCAHPTIHREIEWPQFFWILCLSVCYLQNFLHWPANFILFYSFQIIKYWLLIQFTFLSVVCCLYVRILLSLEWAPKVLAPRLLLYPTIHQGKEWSLLIDFSVFSLCFFLSVCFSASYIFYSFISKAAVDGTI